MYPNTIILSIIFIEFRSNGNLESSAPVHPGLSLHKSQSYRVEKHYLHATGKFIVLLSCHDYYFFAYIRTYVPTYM